MARERDENGRFISGNGGGPGRPPKEREERFLEITLSSCTYADWKQVVKKAVEQARRGNATARKWLSDYLIGPAQQRLDLTTKDESLNSGRLSDDQRAELLAALLERGGRDPVGSDTDE